MNDKKAIRRNLPFDKYRIVESFYSADYCTCDNCNKVLRNVAVIQNSKAETFHVGLDCAKTLSGITEMDIYRHENMFESAKRIRAKVNKAIKLGGTLTVQNSYWSNDIEISVTKVEHATASIDYYVRESVNNIDFLKKYLPEYAAIAKVNFDFNMVDKNERIITESNLNYKQYSFSYKYNTSKYGYVTVEVFIYESGVLLASSGNGGSNFDAVNTEATRLYNKVEFNKGLKPII
jgi:hypothetical protein